ncbi:MAG: COX15/CtaA family protein [Burkholderiaceae bacterium]
MTETPVRDAVALRRRRRYGLLAGATALLTFALIMLGAYVRLSDAGLGCPDWPGCYGKLTPTMAAEHIHAEVSRQGGEHGPVSMGKAWREMVHRYVATFLGLVIIALAVLAWRWRASLAGGPGLPTTLVGVVVLQGLFGMWTVTLLLKPAIVTGHLLGGLLTLALLVWLWQRERLGGPRRIDAGGLTWLVLLALIALVVQISLGGWTSTNYAALACTDLPTCQGRWWPDADFTHAFHVFRELGQTPDGAPLTSATLTAIHLTHRIGAVFASILLLAMALAARRRQGLAGPANLLLALLVAQWTLGLSNVAFSLPLPVAVAHNGGAAALLAVLVVLLFRVTTAKRNR